MRCYFNHTDLSLIKLSTSSKTANVATQTDLCTTCFTTKEQGTWTQDANKEREDVFRSITMDHSYSRDVLHELESESEDMEEDTHNLSFFTVDTDDTMDVSDDINDDISCHPTTDRKFIVFESCLNSLFHTCPLCLKPVFDSEVIKTVRGTLLSVKYTCSEGHINTWDSQPLVNGMSAGNLLTAAAILFSGSTFTHISNLASILRLSIMSKSTFHSIQSNYLFPVVHDTWLSHRQQILSRLQNQSVQLGGDARCDSPGYSAKYCTYSMLSLESREVIDFSLVQVTETTSSVAMEKEGFQRCMQKLDKADINVSVVATDRHIGIASLCKKQYPYIDHQFDIWHVAKSIVKKLTKSAKKKGCEDLFPWIKSICNHLWWACQTSKGNGELLREKWISIVNHVINVHSWGGSNVFVKCSHPSLTNEISTQTKWLIRGSPSHEALKEVIFDTNILKALQQMTGFCHTGDLEVYHSVLLKYCPKRQHFSYEGMLARNELAALDHNNNLHRQQAVTTSGELRYKIVYPKGRKDWVAKPISEDKSYAYIDNMLQTVLEARRDPSLEFLSSRIPSLPPNIAPTPRPPKEDIIQKHQSRFSQ